MRALLLTIESGAAPPGGAVRRVDGGSLTIGRGDDVGWVLPDPVRRLSRRHCQIEQRPDGWSITDTSRNGLSVDGVALGSGRSARLDDGMLLEMGDYRLRVHLENAVAATPQTLGAAPDPFDWLAERKQAPEKFSQQPAAPAGGNDLFDADWLGRVPKRAAEHPIAMPPAPPATPHDHTPPELEALILRSPPPVAAPPPLEPAAAAVVTARAVGEGPFFAPAGQSPPAPAAPAAPRQDDGCAAALAAFLEGAGLPADALAGGDPQAELRAAGAALRALSTGLVQLLRARSMLKRQLAVNSTMIGAIGNNPLKLAVDDNDAVSSLLRRRGPGYLEPLAAIRGAFDDVKGHELAMLDGLRAALQALLQRFDPAQLERQLADTSTLEALLAGGRKAKYWELFKSRYSELARSAETRFVGELGPDFARAYERRTKDRP